MTAIDDQVAMFADELEGLAVFDAQQIAVDVRDLVAGVLAAPTHDLAAVELREFIDARPDAPEYAKAVTVAALAQLGLYVLLLAPIDSMDGDAGLLRRLKRLAYAARGLGLGEVI